MRLKLISCEVFYREMCWAVARSSCRVDLQFLPQGLHDIGSGGMNARLQEAVDRVDSSRYEAVLLGYALCGNGLAGLAARGVPLVLPRAHDCITLFLGGKDRYLDYFNEHPGTYFKTTGWIERAGTSQSLPWSAGLRLEDLLRKYGLQNGTYVWDELVRNYRRFTFIETGLESDDHCEELVREDAARRGWEYEKIRADLRLLEKLVNGEWDEREFLVVPPGGRVAARYDDGIVGVE